ncbi:MAG: hypothetical protein KC478_02485 [Bacteriovoracaceae bacterium]|nr:hypothetical protein [Bacteriovoracaceae bacterium]
MRTNPIKINGVDEKPATDKRPYNSLDPNIIFTTCTRRDSLLAVAMVRMSAAIAVTIDEINKGI